MSSDLRITTSIDTPRWDRTWVFGGAFLGAILAIVCVVYRPVVPLLVALWLAFGDGPHMAALWARTYTDPQTRRERGQLLWGSIVVSLFPVAVVALAKVLHAPMLWDATLGVLGVLSVWHVARQHWGFVSIYRWRANERDPVGQRWDQSVIRAGSYLPWLYALTTHPTLRALTLRPPQPSWIERGFALALLVTWGAILLGYLLHFRRTQAVFAIKHKYMLLVVAAHALAYFLLAPVEPLWHGAQTMDSALAVVTLWLSTFHAVEYIALCHYFLRNGAKREAVSASAARLGQRTGLYLAAVCTFGVLAYVGLGLSTGVFPSIDPVKNVTVWGVPLSRWLLALFWSIAIHHYVLDMRIWRMGSDKRLRTALEK